MSAVRCFVASLICFTLTFASPLGSWGGQRVPNTWLAGGLMPNSRAGACSSLLPDGRVLITGGSAAGGVLNTADIFDPSTGFAPVTAMSWPREGHACAILDGGRVLVAGGRTAGGEDSNTAEIYDPSENRWSTAGPMTVARYGATASLLKNGRVLIAGGEIRGAVLPTLELFDPINNVFEPITYLLSSPRKSHAAAVLADGRALIAGGSDGSTSLSTVDIYDPETGIVTPAGNMSAPRAGLSATTLLDGKVLLAGGAGERSDLASGELYDPGSGMFSPPFKLKSARQGHMTFLLPNNNSVLLVGGSSTGRAVTTAEIYVPWENSSTVIGDLTSGRARAIGSTLLTKGALIVAGGAGARGPLSTYEALSFVTLTTDRTEYSQGMPVRLTGSGWRAGEKVRLTLHSMEGGRNDATTIAEADASGNILSDSFTASGLGAFTVTAKGSASADTALASSNVGAELDQCANGPAGVQPCFDTAPNSNWVNGNLDPNKARYVEGDAIPYRLVMTGLTPGSHTVTIEWDTTKSGRHAIDYLSSWSRSANPGSDPCSGVACGGLRATTFSIPNDPNVTAAGVTPAPGGFTLFGGAINTVSAYSLSGTYASDSSTRITLTFNATGRTAVLAWGGHIAARWDWGAKNSALAIQGSPFHTRLIELDGRGGNQDRSTKIEAVVFPGSITIIKEAAPQGATAFSFTGTPAPLSNFSLVDDGASINKRTFSNIATFTAFNIAEMVQPGWALDSIVCNVDSSGGTGRSSTSTIGVTATINLAEGDNVTCTYTNIKTIKSLQLTKAAQPASYSAVGQTITYTYTLKNTGNIALEGPFSVNDDKLGPITCGGASLAPGASAICTATHTITQADLDAGSITNTASLSDAGATANVASATVTGVQTRALQLTKAADPTSYSDAGQVITYTYAVKNTGNVALAGPFTVTDDKLGAIACGGNPLAPGSSTNCTSTHAITQADLDAGSVINTASASANDLVSNVASATVTAKITKSLQLTKTADPASYSVVGQTITYTYTVKNNSNVTQNGPFAISDDKLGMISCGSAPLAPGASTTCAATHAITQADLDGASITNTATASGSGITSNAATVTVAAVQTKTLQLSKAADPTSYSAAGQVITYTYTIKNTGNVTLAGPFTVTDDKLGSIPCGAGPLSPAASTSCNASYTIVQVDVDAGSVTNTASASGNSVTSNSATATATAIQTRTLQLTKTAQPSSYSSVGQVITYTYMIKNTGKVTLAGPFTVADDKLGLILCGSGPLSPPDSVICTASHVITQADFAAGYITNTATASGNGVISPPASATVIATGNPALTLLKSANPKTFSGVGFLITYTYTVVNSGNVTLAGPFSVSDNKIGVFPCGSGPLAPNATTTCTAAYRSTQADADAGVIINTAQVTGNGVTSTNPNMRTKDGNDVTSPTVSETVTAAPVRRRPPVRRGSQPRER